MTEKLRKAIPLGMATIIGVLAVLGVEGELLDRFIRDHPRQVAIALVLGILGVTVPLLVNAWASKKWGQVIGILLVASGATIATVTGADGVGEREQPDITVTPLAVDADTESVSLKIEALGTHLRSRDRMLLRVSGVSGRVRASSARTPDSVGKRFRTSTGASRDRTYEVTLRRRRR